MAGKVQKGQRCGQFKEGPKAPRVGYGCPVHVRLQLADQGGELLATDQLPVNLRALTDGHQVGFGEQAGT